MFTRVIGTLLVFVGGDALASTWDANLSVTTLSGYESAAFDITWSPVSNDGTFTFDHYKVCWDRRTSSAPDDPTDADRCLNLGGPISKNAADFFVHWSDTEYGLRIYACDLAEAVDACADHYGEGPAEAVTDDTATLSTDQEVWVLEDVNSYSDTSRTVADSNASAAGAFYYSAGTYDDKLGI